MSIRPDHYKGNTKNDIQPIDLIDSQDLGFYEGNIIKYVSRWRKKGGIQDLEKAKFYLERLIKNNEQSTDGEETPEINR